MVAQHDELTVLEQRAPHYAFLAELFAEPVRRDCWDCVRQERFARVKQLVQNSLARLQDLAYQLAGSAVYEGLRRVLREALTKLERVERDMRNMPQRLGLLARLMLWDPVGEGRRLT